MIFRLSGRDTGGHQRITYIARFLVVAWVRHHWGQREVDHSNPKQLYNSFDASSILCYPCKVYHSSTSRDKHEKKHLQGLTHSHPPSHPLQQKDAPLEWFYVYSVTHGGPARQNPYRRTNRPDQRAKRTKTASKPCPPTTRSSSPLIKPKKISIQAQKDV